MVLQLVVEIAYLVRKSLHKDANNVNLEDIQAMEHSAKHVKRYIYQIPSNLHVRSVIMALLQVPVIKYVNHVIKIYMLMMKTKLNV